MTPPASAPARNVALVLGGGGLKGFAHLGVLRALAERGVVPTRFAGTSIGALIAAAMVGGMSVDEMADRAKALRRKDLFRINHFAMLMERMKSPSIYLEEPLRELVNSVIPDVTFTELDQPLLVNTVDVEHGVQVVWGLPGLQDVTVRDAVYASCALPGYFPPGQVGERHCIDGGAVDNLPVNIGSQGADIVIAVDVGSTDMSPMSNATSLGFASVYMRAATVMMHRLQQFPLDYWKGPPMVLVRPKIGRGSWLDFTHTEANIAEGYRAGMKALEDLDSVFEQPGGIFPRRRFRLEVDKGRCTGCGLCVALAPSLMGLEASGKAFARTHIVDWSPADGDFVHQCPTDAIIATKLDRSATPTETQGVVPEVQGVV
ncbi:MAG: patatin-like phospholipase family protein [Gemmatimonadaceae bacterium]|nr:patatin-like phospholipase family protein [Gemmatimonadaceae bacterium]